MSRLEAILQINGLRQIEESSYIDNFKPLMNNYNGNYTFTFGLTQQQIEGEDVPVDFSKYKIRIKYNFKSDPKIFVENPQITTKAPHRYSDGSLCLYHPKNFKWGNDKSIANNLIPWVYLWVYFYSMWLKTGKWYGDEYEH